ncbi:MAG: hypothetical protein GY930_16410 [bacterium]|nr:hypothetical protein [bacterium]
MKKKLLILVAMVVALSLVSLAPATAKKPLTGPMDLEFNLNFGAEGDTCAHITWAGTVELDGDLYEMIFIPTDRKEVGNAVHFWEDWLIYPRDEEDLVFEFSPGDPRVLTSCHPGDIAPVLWGADKGVGTLNDKYRMNSTIDGANAPFGEWLGRNVHMSGIIEWYDDPTLPWDGAPHYAPGVFRAN